MSRIRGVHKIRRLRWIGTLAIVFVTLVGMQVACVADSALLAVTPPAAATRQLTLAATPCPTPEPHARRETAQVVRVIDGDTIEVSIGGVKWRVRYIGMDTPEQGRPFFDVTTEANSRLVEGRMVELEKDVSETDRYGRLLRYVYVGDVMVNAELLRQGYAQVATYPPDVKYEACFLQLQREAREAGRGLWAEPGAWPTAVSTPRPSSTVLRAIVPATRSPTPVAQTAAKPGQGPVTTPAPGSGIVITDLQGETEPEVVVITNMSRTSRSLLGWRLESWTPADEGCRPAQGQNYRFGDITLNAGATVTLLSAEGAYSDLPAVLLWSTKNIWNNKGDRAVLYDANGNAVSAWGYKACSLQNQ